MDDVLIKKSAINGKGLYANRNFKSGETVLEWHPEVITESEAKNISEKYIYRGPDKKIYHMQEPERYVNHSCDANTKVVDGIRDVAIRNIKKGEEITSDYGSGLNAPFKCKCGIPNCRGSIK